MSLQQTLNVQILGAKSAHIEGKSFCSVYVCQPVVNPDEENACGWHTMKLSADPNIYAQFKKLLSEQCPAAANIRAVMKPAAQGAMKMYVVGLDVPANAKSGQSTNNNGGGSTQAAPQAKA